MRPSFLKGYKRNYYINELLARKIKDIDGRSIYEMTDRELKKTLAAYKIAHEDS